MQNGDTRKTNLAEAFKIIESMPEDFMIDGREQDLPQEREGLDDLWTELPSNPKSP
jgi:hypothetical protein